MKRILLPIALLAPVAPVSDIDAAEPRSPGAMRLVITDKHVDFVAADGKLAGRYHHMDQFKPFDFATAMGLTPARVTFIGHIDGTWPVPRIGVTMTQDQKNGLFILETPYALMSLGPSNLAERPLAAGAVLRERYTVTVEDLQYSGTK